MSPTEDHPVGDDRARDPSESHPAPDPEPAIPVQNELPQRPRPGRTRVMYVEYKGSGLAGAARIGRVTYSKTGSTIYYAGRALQSLKRSGYKTSHFDVETREKYWISGPRKDGNDTLYPGVVAIDEDVRVEYWTQIRERPDCVDLTEFRSEGKHSKRKPHPEGRLGPR